MSNVADKFLSKPLLPLNSNRNILGDTAFAHRKQHLPTYTFEFYY